MRDSLYVVSSDQAFFEGDMAAPSRFSVPERFKHLSPDKIREIAKRHAFECKTNQGAKDTEIWVKQSPGGYWVIRIDSQGHGRWHHGRRPHYHKNWVETAKLQIYLTRYLPDAYVYGDDGQLIGKTQDSIHPESKSKAQHIPR